MQKISLGHEASHIDFLDGFRGAAAMIVLLSHFSNEALSVRKSATPGNCSLFEDLLVMIFGAFGNGAGQVGVMIFFSLSAFLMFHLYFEKTVSREQIVRFLVGRVARILPLYYFVVALSILVDQKLPFTFLGIPRQEYFGHFLLYEHTGVLWTIAPELVFYLVFIFIWVYFWGKNRFLFLVLITYAMLCNFLPLVGVYGRIEFFALGFLIWLYQKKRIRVGFEKLGGYSVPLFLGHASLFCQQYKDGLVRIYQRAGGGHRAICFS